MLVIRIVVKIVGVFYIYSTEANFRNCKWIPWNSIIHFVSKSKYIFIIELTVYNEKCSIYPGQDEAQRTKLVKNNYAATPNILQQQNKKETSVHRSNTDAVITTEAPSVRVKRVGRGGGARCFCFFLVALARENDSSHLFLFLLRNNTFFRYFRKNLPKINI